MICVTQLYLMRRVFTFCRWRTARRCQLGAQRGPGSDGYEGLQHRHGIALAAGRWHQGRGCRVGSHRGIPLAIS